MRSSSFFWCRVAFKFVLVVLVACPIISFAQQLEFSDVRWGNNEAIKTKLHIKETLSLENKSVETKQLPPTPPIKIGREVLASISVLSTKFGACRKVSNTKALFS
jgi:hypothetical protein